MWQCAVWQCGGEVVWRCGGVAVWRCDGVALWRCDGMVVRWCGGARCVGVVVWRCDGMVVRWCGGRPGVNYIVIVIVIVMITCFQVIVIDVTSVEDVWCDVRKFVGAQLRSALYLVKMCECHKVPAGVESVPYSQRRAALVKIYHRIPW